MKNISRIALINIGVLLAYSAVIRLLNGRSGGGGSLGIMIMSAFVIVVHVIVCLVVSGAYTDNKEGLGKAWLWSSGIVLLVGFSTCMGNASL